MDCQRVHFPQTGLQVQCKSKQTGKKKKRKHQNLFVEVGKPSFKTYGKGKGAGITKCLKKNKADRFTLTDFKSYSKATVLRERGIYDSIDMQNKTGILGLDPHIQSVDFSEGSKITQWGKDSLLNKWRWNNQIFMHPFPQKRERERKDS